MREPTPQPRTWKAITHGRSRRSGTHKVLLSPSLFFINACMFYARLTSKRIATAPRDRLPGTPLHVTHAGLLFCFTAELTSSGARFQKVYKIYCHTQMTRFVGCPSCVRPLIRKGASHRRTISSGLRVLWYPLERLERHQASTCDEMDRFCVSGLTGS